MAALRETSLGRGSRHNVSAVVIDFDGD